METPADLRNLSPEQFEQLGQDSLRDHLIAQAEVAKQKHGPLTITTLDAFLQDPSCVRYPVRLVFEFGEMAQHQFGQPDHDWRDSSGQGRVIYLRPLLRDQPELIPLAVSYLIPVLNFGAIVSDEVCLAYGAALLGVDAEEYYQRICKLAEMVGAESRYAESATPNPSGGCGGNCHG